MSNTIKDLVQQCALWQAASVPPWAIHHAEGRLPGSRTALEVEAESILTRFYVRPSEQFASVSDAVPKNLAQRLEGLPNAR
jgi:hypothetical protein